jgi:CPA2 family monovalent cation:H+ antiporter-2
MSLGLEIVADLAVIMVIAAAITFVFHKLKQPLILGYLLAGVIIGPYTPPFSLVSRLDVVGATAELGVILLLFTVGLEFPLARLRTIKLRVYGVISVIEIALMFLVSYGAGWLLGWPFMDSLFLGAALASSSTVIIAKVLRDMGRLRDTSALVMMGVLVIEDLVVVLILAVISSVVGAGSGSFPGISWALGKVMLFLIGASIIGVKLVPRVIDWVAQPERAAEVGHEEVLVLVALGLCFGLSVIGNYMGLPMAIGAFLMGVFMASARSAPRVATLTSSIKDMFAAIFFVSMGAFIDVTQFQAFLFPALLITAVMIAGKVVGCGLGTRLFGYDTSTSLKVGLGMGQVGEFALIAAKAGQDLGAVSSFFFPTVGVAVAVTAFLSPYMIRLSYRVDPTRWRLALRRFSR